MTHNAYTPEEPIAAIATPLAPAALGIVRTSGANAITLVSRLFSRPRALCNAGGNTIVYGWIVEGDAKIDEVMVAVYRAPKSFTGEEMAEIFCHGGTATVLGVYNALLKNGFRAAQKGEYTFRAFINGKADLTKAEAVREIIDARTDVSRAHALGRLEGALCGEIESIKRDAVHAMAALEVEIEYPEDEENIADSFDPAPIVAVKERLLRLSRSWAAEKLYQDGAQVVLCGKTNAGKSSLFNILLKEERAIVSDIRGTTRDWLESWAQFDGVPVRLYDTAGLRETDDAIEKAGVERTKDLIAKADALLYVVDGTEGLDAEDAAFLRAFGVSTATGEASGEGGADVNGAADVNATASGSSETTNADSGELKNAPRAQNEVATFADKVSGDINEASGDKAVGTACENATASGDKVADDGNDTDTAADSPRAQNKVANAANEVPCAQSDVPLIVVLNKADKTADSNTSTAATTNADCGMLQKAGGTVPCVRVSAKSGFGITELTQAVTRILKKAHAGETAAAALGSARQKDAVEDALSSVNHALCAINKGFTVDAVVQDLEDAIASLGEITGEITPDDILETVFSSFCVGK